MRTREKIKAQAGNTGLAKVAVKCSADTVVGSLGYLPSLHTNDNSIMIQR
jgi:hypothetical protein